MWPENLECSKFPEDGTDDSLCISNNASSKSEKNSFSTPVSVIHKHDRKNNGMADYKNNNVTGFSHRSIGFICPVQLKAPQVMGYELNVAGKVTKDCGAPCKSLFFDETERTILRYWISSWAALSVASCLFIVRFLLCLKTFVCIPIFWTDLHLHHRLHSLPVPRASNRLPRDLLPTCRLRLCKWLGSGGHCRLSGAFPTSRKIGSLANDLNDYSSELNQWSNDETVLKSFNIL